MKRQAMLAAALALLLRPAIAGAECAWVLWNESTITKDKTELSRKWQLVDTFIERQSCALKARYMAQSAARGWKTLPETTKVIEPGASDPPVITRGLKNGTAEIFILRCIPDTLDPRGPKQ